MLDNLRRSKTLRGLLAATAGFLLYGGWAFFINYEHGLNAGIKAGFTQGSYSFTLTLIMAFFMEWVFGLSDNPKRQFSQTFFTTCLLIYSTSWGVNFLAGTPEIFLTILPGATFSTFYTLSYTLALFKLRQNLTTTRP